MEYYKPEIDNAPPPLAKVQEQKDCTYLSFLIDSNIYDSNGFKLKTKYPNLRLKNHRINNLNVLCIYWEGFFNKPVKWFINAYYFKIIYEFKNSQIFTSISDFVVEKNKIKFIFDTTKKGHAFLCLFKNPSCLEQYTAFYLLSKEHDKIFEDAKNFVASNLNIWLFLHLLEDIKAKREELFFRIFHFLKWVIIVMNPSGI